MLKAFSVPQSLMSEGQIQGSIHGHVGLNPKNGMILHPVAAAPDPVDRPAFHRSAGSVCAAVPIADWDEAIVLPAAILVVPRP